MTMKRLFLTALTAAAPLLAALPQSAVAQTVLREGSEIRFTTRQMGVPVEGRFDQWSAELRFDPKNPTAGQVRFSIQTGSAVFGAAETEAEVKKPDWFNVAKVPTASFQSSAIKPEGPGRYAVSGQLTIKGHSQPLVVPVTLAGNTATGQFTIRRLAFQIGAGEWADTSLVADEVQVNFKLALQGL
jgi:polyisoprenoid-binding protein YceI